DGLAEQVAEVLLELQAAASELQGRADLAVLQQQVGQGVAHLGQAGAVVDLLAEVVGTEEKAFGLGKVVAVGPEKAAVVEPLGELGAGGPLVQVEFLFSEQPLGESGDPPSLFEGELVGGGGGLEGSGGIGV